MLNAAGTGSVCFNCSTNAGTGGVIFSSGGAAPATVATIDNAGNAQFNGTLQVGGTSQSAGTMTVRNNADAEVDYYLWPGLTTSQKGSFTYKDWNGNSQWYMVKDASNNWALNSATGGLDSFKAYQSTNSGDTYIDASNATGHIRLNYETGSGAETDIYSGSSANLVAAFLGPTSIKFPGLAASSGHFCLQVDSSGYLTNTGAACGSGSGSGGTSGTINSGNSGQIAYYTASGTTIGGMNAVPLTAGGTGATSASGAVANLLPGVASDGNNGITVTGSVSASGYNVGGSAFGTANLADWTDSGVASGLCAVWNGTTGKWTPGSCGSSSSSLTLVTTANPAAISGSTAAYDPLTCNTDQIDIRCYGAVIDDTTPIDSALIAAINHVNSVYGGSGTVLLPCVRQDATARGCYLQDGTIPARIGPPAGTVKFVLQGGLQVGTTLVGGNWFTDAGAAPGGFQTGTIPADVYGPSVNGTLGTAITSANTATTITPTFAQGGIANLPVGSAITIAATGTATASATRVFTNSPYGFGQVTLTLASKLRVPPGEIITVTGCSDSSFNTTNMAVTADDYTAKTIVYYQTDATPSTATGCTVTGFNEDVFESARILCSYPTAGTFGGITYNGCVSSPGTVTIMTNHTHLATDQWGEVVAAPGWNQYYPETYDGITFENAYGVAFWSEAGTNLVLNNVMAQAGPYMTSGAAEFSSLYLSHIHGGYFEASSLGQTIPVCPNGGCPQPSYPYAIRCDSAAHLGNLQDPSANGCYSSDFDQGVVLVGGFKIDGSDVYAVTGMPRLTSTLFEEAWEEPLLSTTGRELSPEIVCPSKTRSFKITSLHGHNLSLPTLMQQTPQDAQRLMVELMWASLQTPTSTAPSRTIRLWGPFAPCRWTIRDRAAPTTKGIWLRARLRMRVRASDRRCFPTDLFPSQTRFLRGLASAFQQEIAQLVRWSDLMGQLVKWPLPK